MPLGAIYSMLIGVIYSILVECLLTLGLGKLLALIGAFSSMLIGDIGIGKRGPRREKGEGDRS